VSYVDIVIFLFCHISLFAFVSVFTLYCNACNWHALNEGNLLTYLLTYNAPVHIMSRATHNTQQKCCAWLYSFKWYKTIIHHHKIPNNTNCITL